MHIQPYLYFRGRCEEAIEFYKRAIGAQVQMMVRMSDAPPDSNAPKLPPGWNEKIMHAALTIGDSTVLFSDGGSAGPAEFRGFDLSLNVADAATADKAFAALAAGGTVNMPLSQTFWSPRFGTLTDKFGVAWMVNVTG
jgi:PhnB protein